jgi:VCBS repeat-containing protein
VNDRPVAVDDHYVGNEDALLSIGLPGVLSNDSDADGDALRAVMINPPGHGTVTLNTNGSFNYTPATNFNGTDSFTYRADDGSTSSLPATVTISVQPINDPPVAANDSYTTTEDAPLTVTGAGVLSNDSDADGDLLRAIIGTQPAHGTLLLNTNGSFVYTPATNFNGIDTFTYRAHDGVTNSAPATVTLTVQALNDGPTARDDSYSTIEDTLLVIAAPGVLTNDSDVDGDALRAVLVSSPGHGTLTWNTNGSFSYTPATNFNGTDTFTYRANDGLSNSAVATVTIAVQSVNDSPVAANDSYSTTEDAPLTVAAPGVLANDLDADGDALQANLVSSVSHGTLQLNNNGSFTYVPATNYNGTDSFVYRTTDGKTNSAPASVSLIITPVNDRPIAQGDNYTTDEDVVLQINAPGVLANDSDPDGNVLRSILVVAPQHGSVVLQTNGSLTYTPFTNYNGPDVFTYQAGDGQTNSLAATVSLTVRAVNDAPSFSVPPGYTGNEDSGPQMITGFATNIVAGPVDELGQQVWFTCSNDKTNLFLQQPGVSNDGTLSFTPAPNAFGTAIVSIVCHDNGGTNYGGNDTSATKSFILVINPVNDAPNFESGVDQFVLQDAPRQIVSQWATHLSPGPGNEAEQAVSFVVVNDNESLFDEAPAIDGTGQLTYKPAPNAFGVAHLTVQLVDNGGTANGGVDRSPPQPFVITVNGPPRVKILSPTNGAVFYATMPIPILCSASDPDGVVTNLSLVRNNIAVTNLAPPYLYEWTNPPAGEYQLSATATDNSGLSAVAEPVTISVVTQPPLTIVSPLRFNPQTGLFEETVRISNVSPLTLPALQILVSNLAAGVTVYNSSGTTNGLPYVRYNYPVSPGSTAELRIEYYVPNRVTPNPTLLVKVVSPAGGYRVEGTPARIDRLVALADGSMLIDFSTVSNRTYYIQYSCDLVEWETALPCVTGNGNRLQWLDNGPPKTDGWPGRKPMCAYRILQLPSP